MESIQVDIINPKAKELLKNLADLNLIVINDTKVRSNFSAIIKQLREKSTNELSLEEITEEVERVRASRYDK